MAMSTKDTATRRRFFFGAGAAALAAPVAFATSVEAGAPVQADVEALAAQLAALEDANAIRSLQREHARRLGAREAGDIAIEIAADRRTATARTPCVVPVESPIEAPGCTLVDMARAQGEGVLRRDERRVLEQTFVRREGVWQSERTQTASWA
jgi:hypothetical protein